MKSPFSTLTKSLKKVFGGRVTIYPSGKMPRDIDGIFRDLPVEIPLDGGGHINTTSPILRASKLDVSDLFEGDLVDPHNGRTFRYLTAGLGHNPAADGFVECALEEIT